MVNKILLGISIILFVVMLVFIFLWKYDNTRYKDTCKLLTDAENRVDVLEKEKQNLLEYNLRKEEELKQVEAEYKERLENIPTDNCGDVKPSKELLIYLRKQNKL